MEQAKEKACIRQQSAPHFNLGRRMTTRMQFGAFSNIFPGLSQSLVYTLFILGRTGKCTHTPDNYNEFSSKLTNLILKKYNEFSSKLTNLILKKYIFLRYMFQKEYYSPLNVHPSLSNSTVDLTINLTKSMLLIFKEFTNRVSEFIFNFW